MPLSSNSFVDNSRYLFVSLTIISNFSILTVAHSFPVKMNFQTCKDGVLCKQKQDILIPCEHKRFEFRNLFYNHVFS